MTDIEFNRNTPQLINFEGIIDGNNHKITLHGNSLIESAKNGVVIKNLTLDGTVRAENNAAAFIGNIDAAEQGVRTVQILQIFILHVIVRQASLDMLAGIVF